MPRPELAIVVDFEAQTTSDQALTFGAAQLREIATRKLRREWLIHADSLPEADLATLRRYIEDHRDSRGRRIHLISRSRFVREILWRFAYVGRVLVVGFNLPFDLSRLAVGWQPARTSARGGFSLQLWSWTDSEGRSRQHDWRPNIAIKALGSKRQLISFTSPRHIDPRNRVDGKPFRGHFLDLHQLAYALTDRSYTLAGAARAFGVEAEKDRIERHGEIYETYISYCRQDVEVTWQLFCALGTEWAKHPIALDPEQAFSPATVGRAYLREMGVTPPLTRGIFPEERLGHAMVAYLGGRCECRIRRVPLPCVYVDFTSMYPTVFELLGLWSWIVADRIEVASATEDAGAILARVTRQTLFDRQTWASLAGVFCLVRPMGQLLPSRAPYGVDPEGIGDPGQLTIGLNPLWSDVPMWFTLADLVVAKLLGGSVPPILDAFRVVPSGVATALRPVALRSHVLVDPRRDSLFRRAIEERKRLAADPTLSEEERDRLSLFLKTLANAAAYGLFAQYDQLDPRAEPTTMLVDGLSHFDTKVTTAEEPGEFSFAPLAATITGAGRLLLALLQAEVEALGGTYVTCDTDSLVIVACRDGVLFDCPNGPLRAGRRPAVRALSFDEARAIIERFNTINPYDSGAVPSLLKLEDVNFGPDGRQIDLWCLAISAKRYVLYERTTDGVRIRKASEHGLGLYRRPVPDPDGWANAWPAWVEEVWIQFIAECDGLDPGEAPAWHLFPAVGQLTISSTSLLEPFASLNAGRPATDQVRPFNFLLIAHPDPLFPLPVPAAAGHLSLVAPYDADPSRYLELPWRNRFDGQPYAVTTDPAGLHGAVRIKAYGDVIAEYRVHPEVKSGDPRGGRCRRSTRGYLPRRSVIATGVVHVGKESNRIEEVEGGLIGDTDEVLVRLDDPAGEWEHVWLPRLRAIGVRELARRTGISARTLRSNLNSGRLPHPRARAALIAAARGTSDPTMSRAGEEVELDWLRDVPESG
jgi:hypothetical protein